jgi:large repetitive protein
VTFPGTALPSGEQATTITVTATDAAGNTATTSRPVRIDTTTSVSVNPGQTGGDDIIAGSEQQAGVALTGRAEAGASVAVTLEGVTRTVTAASDGTWTATFARAEIPTGTYTSTVSVRATDLAGNVATTTHALSVDTEVRNFAKVGESTGTDGVLNFAEAATGLSLTGTVEPGSTVMVKFGTGQTRPANVNPDGTWSITIPASDVPAGESDVTLTMTATDRVGNMATLTEQVQVDTLVRTFTRSGGTIGGDGVLNAAEVGQGLPLAGTVEPGSTVVVRLSNGSEKTVVAGASGQWSVSFAASELPVGERDVNVSLTATDPAGNTATLTDSFRVDTVAPGSPEVVSFRRDANGLRDIGTEATDDIYTFTRVDASGGQSAISATRTDDPEFGETNFRFSSPVPDGSYLVVNTADTAGNQSSTLFIVDNTNATTVDLNRPGLASFDFAAIDLTFAPESQMTINESQLNALTGPDHRLIVKGGDDDTVTMTGAEDTRQSTVIDGERYNIFTLGNAGATVLLDDDIRTVI